MLGLFISGRTLLKVFEVKVMAGAKITSLIIERRIDIYDGEY